MRQTDISKYTDKIDIPQKKQTSGIGAFFSALGRLLLTVLGVLVIAGIIVGVSLGIYIFGLANEPTGIDLNARSLNLSSFIYTKDPDTGEFKEYQTLYGTENRIWVDLSEMPKCMPKAIIAIEDKRFIDHHGVDWTRTGSAIVSLITGSDNYGGSTITQQLIKNITDDNEVSLTRKLREIFRALNIEKEYSKDDIIEAYLNVVNFGNNCQGVEAASQLYFDKSIGECSVCECAAIAGITQNPSRWNPLIYPENNRYRRELVLSEMYDQGMLTKAEYDAALKESETLTFVGWGSSSSSDSDDDEDDTHIQNWYIDQMYFDLCRDLAKYYGISEGAASEKLYTEGLKIYCAMDIDVQNMIEAEALSFNADYDYDLQCGMTMVDFDGRVIATVGSSKEKEGNLDWDRASHSVLQPGSSIKSIIPYPLAIDTGVYNYSSLVMDQPYEKWRTDGAGGWIAGPDNAYGSYMQYLTVAEAVAWSSNAAAVQTINLLGTQDAFSQATSNLGFKHLAEDDAYNLGALSIGGMVGGVTVREMAAAITYVGNGGLFYEPYTYYYVTDAGGNIILDNRNNIPIEAYTPETAYKMNRILRYNVLNSQHSASPYAAISGWDIVGKTGTTDYDKDIWFVGASPYCAMAVWMGYDQPDTVPYGSLAAITWQKVMSNYLAGKPVKEFDVPATIIPATYCKGSGMLASSFCYDTDTGYYSVGDMPGYCDGYHKSGGYVPSSDEPGGDTPTDETPSEGEGDAGDTPTEDSGETPTDSGGGEPEVPQGGGEDTPQPE